MKYKHYFFVWCLHFCQLSQVYSQVIENAVPWSAAENLPEIDKFEILPQVDDTCLNTGAFSQEITRFACPVLTDLSPENSGQWASTSRGKIWRMGIRSDKAHSLYVNMLFKLAPESKVFVYGPGFQNLQGAFKNRNNNPAEVLTISPIPGETLIIELNIPHRQPSYGKLKITKVYHDFYNIFKDTQSRKSVACNEDINCSNGKYWQTEKRAVCKIISNGYMGTGTLVGNTSGTDTPYFLTAHHLISSAEAAAETLFIFNHETSGCNEGITGNSGSLSGAELLSTTDHQLDFSLLKLYETPPPSYRPYYAGWDARDISALTGTCIHHPFGETKEVAIEYHPIEDEDIGKGFDPNSTWKVAHWEIGTTEQGSSGAPLFNERHRLIGTLTGGRSTCNYSRDDYFTKFGASWDSYPQPSNQLKYWLDPDRTGQLVMDGYDPYGFNEEHCSIAWNFTAHDKIGLSNKNMSWGWISGHNSAGFTQFAERYEPAGTLQINGVYLNVAKAYASNPLAHIEVKVWEGSSFPEKERYSKLLFINSLQENTINYVAFDTVLSHSKTLFVGYKINYGSIADTFALYHAEDRGFRQASSMYIYNQGWQESKDPNMLGKTSSLGIGLSECYGKSYAPAPNVLNVFPNPCTNSITLDIPGRLPIHDIICYDTSGRTIPVNLHQNEEGNKLYFDLKSGIYYLRVITAEKSFFTKFIVKR